MESGFSVVVYTFAGSSQRSLYLGNRAEIKVKCHLRAVWLLSDEPNAGFRDQAKLYVMLKDSGNAKLSRELN